jgi:D-serine deaminase-like pyridoxal phosphate-dependent protein
MENDGKPILKAMIETPALVIDLDILAKNIRTMASYMEKKRAQLRPHFKTYKCPTISHMQITAGAKGITCAKLSEAELLVAAGIQDVLIANQVVDPVKINRLAALAGGDAKITVAVDAERNIEDLSRAADFYGSTLYVLIEVDVGMGRCGINSKEEALRLAEKIVSSQGLSFEGIQAYEGHLQFIPDFEKRRSGVEAMVEKVGSIKEHLESRGIPVREISGAGTGTYNITGDNTIWTEIQAGSYVFMDTAYNKIGLEFENALTILTTVIHKRTGFAVCDAGMKVCSVDHGLPEISKFPKCSIHGGLAEEHGIIADPEDALNYLQKIEYIPSHCCTTVNLYDCYYCVRNEKLEAVWPITGRGKSQ